MTHIELLQYVEIDVPRCANTYGQTPCTASVGVTGDFKCYNCPATCQDPQNYVADDPLTVRFAIPTEELPQDIICLSNIKDRGVKIRAQEIRPAESLGTRESVTVSFQNHRHNDVGYDLYPDDRNFNPYNQGTHWGKFISRWPNLQGKPLRVIRGTSDQSLAEMETRHYFIESSTGPDMKGDFSIDAKDALKFLDGKKAVFPRPSSGVLASAITDQDTSLTLSPAGVGDAEYPASGLASIGDEMVTFSRSADSVTLTGRGLRGTEQEDHDADETFQLSGVFSGADPADIIDELIFGTNIAGQNYTETPSAYQNLSAWQAETEQFFGRLYSAEIARPTPVKELVSEIIEQVGLLFYSDIINQKLILRVLRQGTPVLNVTDDNTIAGSLRFKLDEEKRINACFTFYAQKNPLEKLDEDGNFKSISALYDADPVKALEDLPLSIKKIRSRWITNSNRPAAEALNETVIDRYGDTPGMAMFRLPVEYPVALGSSITVASRLFENHEGEQDDAQPAIVTTLNRTEAQYDVAAEFIKFRKAALPDRVILIDANAFDLNLRTVHDLIYTPPEENDEITVIIASGVIVGSENPFPGGGKAFDVGDWPANVTIHITNNGRIQGYGGSPASSSLEGGEGGDPFFVDFGATPGGTALYTRYPITIDNTNGELWSGGGGGGANTPPAPGTGTVGGGGSGFLPAGNATTEAGGTSPTGGDGGDPGQSGQNGTRLSGTSAGDAVDGDSFITYEATGDIRGAQVN